MFFLPPNCDICPNVLISLAFYIGESIYETAVLPVQDVQCRF